VSVLKIGPSLFYWMELNHVFAFALNGVTIRKEKHALTKRMYGIHHFQYFSPRCFWELFVTQTNTLEFLSKTYVGASVRNTSLLPDYKKKLD
jgi:hypothetical protein